jgi:hypothetical protein
MIYLRPCNVCDEKRIIYYVMEIIDIYILFLERSGEKKLMSQFEWEAK